MPGYIFGSNRFDQISLKSLRRSIHYCEYTPVLSTFIQYMERNRRKNQTHEEESTKERCWWGRSLRWSEATCSKGRLSLLKNVQWQTLAMSTVGQGDRAKEPGVRSFNLSSLHLATDTTTTSSSSSISPPPALQTQ